MKRWLVLAALAGLVGHGAAAAADASVASDGDFPPKASPEAMIYRGNIVYSNYCVLCHGVKADGMLVRNLNNVDHDVRASRRWQRTTPWNHPC